MSHETTDGTTLIALNPYGKSNPSALSINTKIEPVSVEVCPPTPSPTEAEFNYLHNVKGRRNVMRWIRYIVPALLVFTVLILISVFKDQIVDGLKPFTDWMQQHNIAGAAIIIAAMVIVSFPPLLGHEILTVLCGVTYNIGEALLVDTLGTLGGEVACFFAFKYACTSRGKKLEANNIEYGALAHVVRQGGLLIVLVMRYSAIPGHLSTPMFSTVGVPSHIFLAAAVLSVPKSFVPVYVGWSARPENDNSQTAKILSKVVLATSLCITLATLYWIYRKMEQAKEAYIYSRRKARQAKAAKGPVTVALNESVNPLP
ncbi:hypothetical protein R3P38DRAFT_2561262 [Favolaschia claudopus]|uniref:Golgi apparatus membrane protein TVP38 n=1 Tax=Favolaschia claudopus TaxID=2862362 RepID=A0AAW0A3N7_9AGAR